MRVRPECETAGADIMMVTGLAQWLLVIKAGTKSWFMIGTTPTYRQSSMLSRGLRACRMGEE